MAGLPRRPKNSRHRPAGLDEFRPVTTLPAMPDTPAFLNRRHSELADGAPPSAPPKPGGLDSAALLEDLLQVAHVAVVPFGGGGAFQGLLDEADFGIFLALRGRR